MSQTNKLNSGRSSSYERDCNSTAKDVAPLSPGSQEGSSKRNSRSSSKRDAPLRDVGDSSQREAPMKQKTPALRYNTRSASHSQWRDVKQSSVPVSSTIGDCPNRPSASYDFRTTSSTPPRDAAVSCCPTLPQGSAQIGAPLRATDDIPEADGNPYDFRASAETPPSDHCMARSCFNPALNQTASQYAQLQERRRMRQAELDLLMGMLGAANQDDVISVPCIKEFTENRLSSYGISKVEFLTNDDAVTVKTEGVLTIEDTFPISELTSRTETLLVNGKVTPYPTSREGHEEYCIPWNPQVLQDDQRIPRANENSSHQFYTRRNREDLKNRLARQYHLEPRKFLLGRALESTFSTDGALQSTNYDRAYNVFPTASGLEEAVNIICEDDYIPRSQIIDDFDIIHLGLECVSGLSPLKLLKFYYCIVNSTYDVKGPDIRHVQFCRG